MEQTNTINPSEEHNQIPMVRVKLRLDSDVINFFKSIDEREELINRILREEMEAAKAAR